MSNLGLFAVADGVGGAQAGDVASQMAMEILGEAFTNQSPNSDAEDVMKIAIERANSAIFQMSSDLPSLSMMATTIVALHLSGNIATIGHVGDSRLYRLDGKGSLYRETQDHSVVEEEVRAGRMTAAQAANHPSRNVISRALGAESGVEVDMKTIMFEPNTAFMVCSDGITRHITDFEIRELLFSNASPADICQRMKVLCYERGAEDNLTAVIVKIVGTATEIQETPPTKQLSEIEEVTVASARSATAETASADFSNYDGEVPTTRNLVMPESMQPEPQPETPQTQQFTDTDEDYLIQETEVEEQTEIAEESNSAVPQTMQSANSMSFPAQETESEVSYNDYSVEPKSNSGGFIGKLFGSLVLLIIGGVLGAAGYYVWQTFIAPPQSGQAKLDTMKSENVPFTEFEKLRRNADSDPTSTIEKYEKSEPKDAADYYLFGRAYLNNKEFGKAKEMFLKARDKVFEYPEEINKKVLIVDITTGLAVVNEKVGQEQFEKEWKNMQNPNSNSPSNNNPGTSAGQSSTTSPPQGEPKVEDK
jgi:protein phosphatase